MPWRHVPCDRRRSTTSCDRRPLRATSSCGDSHTTRSTGTGAGRRYSPWRSTAARRTVTAACEMSTSRSRKRTMSSRASSSQKRSRWAKGSNRMLGAQLDSFNIYFLSHRRLVSWISFFFVLFSNYDCVKSGFFVIFLNTHTLSNLVPL